MTAVHDADRILRDIDHVLANQPIDLDDLLCHPGQLHVDVAKLEIYQDWQNGDVDDDWLQGWVDTYLRKAVIFRLSFDPYNCWLCDGFIPTGPGDACSACREKWAQIVGGMVPPITESCLRLPHQGPEVDGIQHYCAHHHEHMAAMK